MPDIFDQVAPTKKAAPATAGDVFDQVDPAAKTRAEAAMDRAARGPRRLAPPPGEPLVTAPEVFGRPTPEPPKPASAPTEPRATISPTYEPDYQVADPMGGGVYTIPNVEKIRRSIANTAVGHSLESTMPKVADALGLRPTETVYSPQYEQHKDQVFAPEEMVDRADPMAHGFATAVGGIPNAPNMAIAAGTMGLGEAIAPLGVAARALLPRLVSGGFSLQMIKGLYEKNKEFKRRVDAGDVEGAEELVGQAFVEGPMAATTAFHAATGGGAVKDVRDAVSHGMDADEQTRVNEPVSEPKVQSPQGIPRDEQGDIFDQVAAVKPGISQEQTKVAGAVVPKVIAGFDKAGRMAGEPGFEGEESNNRPSNDVAKQEVAAAKPAPTAATNDTKAIHSDPFSGQYTPERSATVHKPAIEAVINGKTPSGQQPTITVMGGGSASGKTTAVRQIMGDNPNLVNIDADANKLRIPEYEGLKQTDPQNAAWLTHEESADLSKMQLGEAIRRKLDIVLDATTTGNASVDTIKKLKASGYKVDLKFVDVPVEVAQQRALTRAQSSTDPTNRGRFVPPHIIEENHGLVGAFDRIKDLADSAELYDNTGRVPELVYQRLGTEPETVYNQDRYEAFKRKGQAKAAAATAPPGPVRDAGGRQAAGGLYPERDGGQPATGAVGKSRAVAGEIVRVPVGDITTKEKDFQPRERLNAERVSSIAGNMRRAGEFGDREPIDLWKDPQTGKLIVLSGHHRLAAAKEAGMSDATARIHTDMTRAEAQDFARQSNAKAAPLTAMEQARAFEAEVKAGKSAQDIGQSYGGLTSTQVEDTRRLTKLAPELQRYVQDGMFDQKRAEVLARATERYSIPPEVQKQAFDYVIKRREITPAQFGKLLDTFAPAAVKQIGFDFGNQKGFEGMGGFKGLADVMDEYNDAITKLNASRRRLKGFMNEVQRQEREGRMVSPAKRAAVREIQDEVNQLQKQVEGMEEKAGKGEVFKTLGSEIRKAQEAEPQVTAPDEGPELLSPRAVKLDEPEVETTSQRTEFEPPANEPEVHNPQTTMFSGTAVMDPAAWRAVFPSATDWIRGKVGDREMSAGELERGIVRQRRGELDRAKAVIFKALEGARKEWNKADKTQSVEFADAIERGDLSKLSPEHKALAEQLADMLKQRRLDIQALGTGALDSFIEDYFPHNWEKPGKAKQVFQQMMGAKRPLKGPASFLKQRTIPTIKEGLAKGLTPVTYNPVEAVLLKAYEMDRFLMAHQIMADMKANDLAKFVKLGDHAPEDWAKVNDTMFRVMQRVMTVDETTGKQSPAFAIRGEYWAPKEAAAVLNNFLSPGLSGNRIYDAFRGASNVLNQAQLGFSAFHLGFTTIDAATSDMALAIEHASRGSLGKAVAPAARSLSFVGSTASNLYHGNKMMAEYLSPGTYPEYARLVQAVEAAGGRAQMDPTYKNESVQRYRTAMKEKSYGKAMVRAVPAVLEISAKPIMEWTVPRQKLGVFHGLASDILERADKGRWDADKTRAELQKAWDTVDDRMGQVVYDNLFWNKAAKDLAMVSVRSVGWNFGSGRQIGGGIKDFGTQGLRAAIGERPEVTHRMAYVMALPIIAGFYGALYQKIATGKGPEETKDYFFPKTGRLTPQGLPERVSLPTYMKDVYAVKQDPARTVANKLHPAIAATAQFLSNEDYYGTEIRHEGDPVSQQIRDSLIFTAKQVMPFSYRNALQRRKTGATIAQTAQSFVGITPAPGYIVRSPAQELTHQQYLNTLPNGGRTKEQAAQSNTRHDLTAELRAGTIKAADLWNKVRSKEITPADAGAIQRAARTDSFVHEFGSIPLPAALEAWDKMSPEERVKMRPQLIKKTSQLEKYLPEQREQLQAKLRKALSAGKSQTEPTVKAGLF